MIFIAPHSKLIMNNVAVIIKEKTKFLRYLSCRFKITSAYYKENGKTQTHKK
jgi:hypothetical protein